MPVREFVSSANIVNTQLPPELRTSPEKAKILGLRLDPIKDCFLFITPKFDFDKRFTRKVMLSFVAKLFDPLGFLCLALLEARLLISEIWIHKELGWDDKMEILGHRLERWLRG